MQWRKKPAASETVEWTLYKYADPENPGTQISKLAATATSVNLPDLDAGATYEVQVRAVTDEEAEGPWSDTGEGTANTPPTAADGVSEGNSGFIGATLIFSIPARQGNSEIFTDAEGDPLMLFGEAEEPALITVSVTGAAGNSELRGTTINPGTSNINYGAHDGYGGYVRLTYRMGAYDVRFFDLAENSPEGTLVGSPVTGRPYDDGDPLTDDALTYTLQGKAADSGLFVIDSASGQISVADGATIDYETTDTFIEEPSPNGFSVRTYTGQVHYTVDGNAASIGVNILLQDIEAGKPGTPSVNRTPSDVPMNPALDVAWTAPADTGATITGYEVQWCEKVADGETPKEWILYTYTYTDPEDQTEKTTSELAATATSVNLPDLDAGATYEAQVRALTQLEGEGPWSDTGEGRANQPPAATAVSLDDDTVPWKKSADYDLSDKFEDADSDTLTYSASSEYPGVLTAAITGSNSDTLTVTVVNPSAATTVTYAASDPYGGYISRTVAITGQGAVTRSVRERSAAGTAVGDPVTGTPYDDGDSLTNDALAYTLTGEATDAFAIDSATGQISVKTGATLDSGIKASYSGTVSWTVQKQAAGVSLTINVLKVAPPPTPEAPSVTESATDPTDTLDVEWTAPSTSGSLPITDYDVRYRVDGADGWKEHSFSGTGTSTAIGGVEAGIHYEVQVRATNDAGSSGWSESGRGGISVLVSVSPPVDPVAEGNKANLPVSISLPVSSTVTVSWSTAGASVPPVEIASEAAGSSVPSGQHEHTPSSGTVTIQPGETQANIEITILDDLEHEDEESFSIVLDSVVASSSLVQIDDSPAPVTILDDDAAPEFGDGDSAIRSVAENQPASTAVGAPITATDADNDTLTYSLSGDDASAFTLDSATGQLWTNFVLDFESKSIYNALTVTVNDGHDHTDTIAVTVNVTDVDEGPPLPRKPPPPPTPNPTPAPTPNPTPAPTPNPTPAPTPNPTPAPTPNPTPAPTPEPTPAPTPEPTPAPTPNPTPAPTPEPTPAPTPNPTPAPTPEPTPAPTPEPTSAPTPEPTSAPTPEPTPAPTPEPTPAPTPEPTPASASASKIASAPKSAPVPAPEPTPRLSLVSNPGDSQRQSVRREVGQAGLNPPVRMTDNDEFAGSSLSAQVMLDGVATLAEFDAPGADSTSAQVSPDGWATLAEFDAPGADSMSAQVSPDGDPGPSLLDLSFWLALSLALLLLPFFFLMRRRRKKKELQDALAM